MKKDSVEDLLDQKLLDYFHSQLKFDSLTKVQEESIRYFLNKFDCVVQAPTGSGKTLAYGLPMVHTLNIKKTTLADGCCAVLGLVLAPSRELVSQIGEVLKPLGQLFDLKVIKLVGGGGKKRKLEAPFVGNCIVIGTPGRVVRVLDSVPNLKKAFRHLEVLIIDEADRFSDEEFKVSVSNILSVVPKQRTTGLYSATQAKEMEEFLKFGLRNPKRIMVSANEEPKISETLDTVLPSGEATPTSLENFYVISDAGEKLLTFTEFLKGNMQSKMLVFMSSAWEVEYMADILPHLVDFGKKPLMAVHRRKFKKRESIIKQFAASKNAILLCTDIMARGLDINGIDWVVQYDIPKQTSWFVHRSGRTARQGKQGKSVVFLNKEEEAYVDFLAKHEQVFLKHYPVQNVTKERALELREKVRGLALADRKVLVGGTRAFVSFIQFYIKHDCKIVCKLAEQDVPGIAHSFGLHRLPVMKEFRGRADLQQFENSKLDLSKVPYKNEKFEAKRQAQIAEKKEALEARLSKRSLKRKAEPEDATKKPTKPKKKSKVGEWEELQKDQRLLKQFKRGKISKQQLREEL